MIYPILNTIAEELNTFMFQKWRNTANGTAEIVELNNIADLNGEKNELQDKIIITLIKTEEEPSLKNGSFYSKQDKEIALKHNPAIYLNMYLLFSITKRSYKEALQLLSDTILYFQSHRVFEGSVEAESEASGNFKLTMELQDMPLQEIFELWSNLGNKQVPFVVYKARVLKLMDRHTFKTTHLIKETHLTATR